MMTEGSGPYRQDLSIGSVRNESPGPSEILYGFEIFQSGIPTI
ncbi:hypothetical protein QUF90_19630 [Desulfococcaceae bacterium HSG9]|nr:hypothetical protein [Desulfococcaceae bacterium HSG9]